MHSELRWRLAFWGRVGANAAVGGLGLAIPAMVGGVIVGSIWDWLGHAADRALNLAPAPGISPHLGASIGVSGGIPFGFMLGALLFAIAAARAKPGRTFEPLRALFARVAAGIVAGALGFCSLFLVVEWARAALIGKSFYVKAMSDSGWLLWGTIALMLCGAIAGALSKRYA